MLDLSQVGGGNSGGDAASGSEEEEADGTVEQLFGNRKIQRRLKQETVQSIFEYMVSTGAAGWLDLEGGKGKKQVIPDPSSDDNADESQILEQQYALYEASTKKSSLSSTAIKNKSAILVYWRRPSEWATLISDWVDSTGQNGSVLTLYELVESDAVQNQEFRGLHPAILKEVVDVLVGRQKAAVMRDGTGLVAGIKVM